MSSTSDISRLQKFVSRQWTVRTSRVRSALSRANGSILLAGLALTLLLPSCGVEFCASVPVLESISPASVQAGGPDFTLTLKGRHFHSDSSVLWNGSYLFGKTISENEIQVKVPAESILHVPRDISVVGFDDIQGAAYNTPSLTTVRQPLARMGAIAAQTLLERIEQSTDDPKEIAVEPELMVRESTAKRTGA